MKVTAYNIVKAFGIDALGKFHSFENFGLERESYLLRFVKSMMV